MRGIERPARSVGTGALLSAEEVGELGSLIDPQWKPTRRSKDTPHRREGTVRADGYVAVSRPGHPLSWGKTAIVHEHAERLFEALGWGPHACHWCGLLVNWRKADGFPRLVVDHLNDVRHDNRLVNLVPSCSGCNANRGKTTSRKP